MNKIVLSLFLALQVCNVNAQYNLVPNPSFEIYDTCPYYANQVNFAPPWSNPCYGPTPDYLNACDTSPNHILGVPDNIFGHQNARTGSAYMHIIVAWFPVNPAAWNYREYIQVELNDTLNAGIDYCIRWYVSACDSCHYVTNNMGMYFSPVQILDTTYGVPLPLSPQFENPLTNNLNDRFGWTEISGTYTATGGEKFIVIGNFYDTASTIVTSTGWSSPNLILFDAAEYYIDDVLVTPCDSLTTIEGNEIENTINVFPNPFHEHLSVTSELQLIKSITFTDVVGKIIFKDDAINTKRKEVILPEIQGGVYLLKVVTNYSETNLKLIKK